jgi:hypothetical protein
MYTPKSTPAPANRAPTIASSTESFMGVDSMGVW